MYEGGQKQMGHGGGADLVAGVDHDAHALLQHLRQN
jgi:hypothetical protein